MHTRKLAALVVLLCAGVLASLAWYLAGEQVAAQERAEDRPAPVPTSQALPPGRTLSLRCAAAEGRGPAPLGS
jgi:hypothetical protein